MRSTPATIVRFLQSKSLLLAIAVALAGLHLYLISTLSYSVDAAQGRNTASEFLSIASLFWGAALYLVWQKRQNLRLQSDVFSSFLGIALIIFVCFYSLSLSKNDDFLHFSPLISGLGVSLIASGFKGLKQYWRELFLLAVLSIPVEDVLARVIDLDVLTAQFANFLLVHLGFEASRQGVVVALPTGAVEVNPGCSGLRAITRLLQLAALILVMLPTKAIAKLIVPIIAVAVAFTINSIRVAVLVLLIANSHRKAFDFWHEGTGSHGISMVSVIVLWLLCQMMLKPEESQTAVESEE